MRGTRLVVVGERTMKQITEDTIREALRGVNDPELGINVVDLGLVYKIQVVSSKQQVVSVEILMTLTTVGCPLGPWFIEQIQEAVATATGLDTEHIMVIFTFDPPWTQDMMDNSALAELGLD